MTVLFGFLLKFGPWLLSAAGVLAAVVGAWFHGKSTGQAKAQDEAKAAIGAAQSQAATAQQQAAQAAADAEEAKASLKDVQTASDAREAAQQIPDDQLDAELAKLGALRKD